VCRGAISSGEPRCVSTWITWAFKVAFSLLEKIANRESARPDASEWDGDQGLAFIGYLLAEREGYFRTPPRSGNASMKISR
jgi:hypothetical protein